MKIKGSFRQDFKRMFELTDILSSKELKHTPFIVLGDEGVALSFSAIDLVRTYEIQTKVLVQWKGEWRSDFFLLTVGDVKLALAEKGEFD